MIHQMGGRRRRRRLVTGGDEITSVGSTGDDGGSIGDTTAGANTGSTGIKTSRTGSSVMVTRELSPWAKRRISPLMKWTLLLYRRLASILRSWGRVYNLAGFCREPVAHTWTPPAITLSRLMGSPSDGAEGHLPANDHAPRRHPVLPAHSRCARIRVHLIARSQDIVVIPMKLVLLLCRLSVHRRQHCRPGDPQLA